MSKYWKNACSTANKHEYVGSYEVITNDYIRRLTKDKTALPEQIDLYAINDEIGSVSFCLRHGNEPNDYWSPSLSSISRSDIKRNVMAFEMLNNKGSWSWKKN